MIMTISKYLYLFLISDLNVSEKSRITKWTEVNECDVKIFLAHILGMGLTRKSNMEKYWSQERIVNTPWFGKYMSKNTFQLMMANLHINDNSKQPGSQSPLYDPLYKVRPLIDLTSKKFKEVYSPDSILAFDEGTCPWKGRLSFKVYNPSKPNRFHIKLYQTSESATGFIVAYDIYAGKKNPFSSERSSRTLDGTCTKTTKVVMGLLERSGVLDKGHKIYMDNYYTSPELFEELYYRYTFACGTCRKNRKGLPNGVSGAKLKKKGEMVFRRNGPLLALKWFDKRSVYMLTTIHDGVLINTGKVNYQNEQIWKPEAVHDYVKHMRAVDLGDQMMSYNNILRRSHKWWRKLFIHILNMALLNAYILHSKYGNKKLSHEEFTISVISQWLEEGVNNCNWKLPPLVSNRMEGDARLSERHFLSHIPCAVGAKRLRPSRPCFVCNQIPRVEGVPVCRKWTSFWCEECKKPLCLEFCFKLYHTVNDYKTAALDYRLQNLQNVQG